MNDKMGRIEKTPNFYWQT